MEINVGWNLKRLRHSKMTQAELAEALHTTQRQIVRYEKGEQDMTVGRLTEIAEILKVSPCDLLEPEDVLNAEGKELNFWAAVQMMDDEIREDLHERMSPCKRQEFFAAYEKAHREKYGEPWELSKRNPTW